MTAWEMYKSVRGTALPVHAWIPPSVFGVPIRFLAIAITRAVVDDSIILIV